MKKTVKIITTITALTSLSVATIHVINRVQFSKYRLENASSDQEEGMHEFDWKFGKIKYSVQGNGSPILLVHSLEVGSSGFEFHKIISELSKDHKVYTIDLLGYGESEKVNMTMTNYLYVQLLTDFINTIIGRKTDILTSGQSSSLAIMLCHNEPDLINQIICIGAQSIYQSNLIPTKQTKCKKLLLEIPIIGTLLYHFECTDNKIKERFTENYYYDQTKIEEEVIKSYSSSAHSHYKQKYTYASLIGRYINNNIIHALKEVNHNIILLYGDKTEDLDTIKENYLYYNSAIESGEIPNTKLLPHLEDPVGTMEMIKTYL